VAAQTARPTEAASSRGESNMPKGQRSTKEAKKPKKDSSPSKPLSPDAVQPTVVTQVMERGKKKGLK
jgi:hypothetical protein